MANVTLVKTDNQTPLGQDASNPIFTQSAGSASAPAVVAFSDPATRWFYAGVTGGIVDTTDVVLKTAAGAGVRNYLSAIQFANSAAAVSSEIVVKDGATVIWRGWAPQGGTTVSIMFNPPLQSTANTALNVAMITTATATRVSAQGYTG